MKISISNSLMLGAALVFVASCKPAEKTTIAPVTNNPPPVAPAVTNQAVATNAAVAPAMSDKPIAPEEARNHIGETVTVKGKISDVHVTQKGDVFINFGGKFPNVTFTAVSFQGAIPAEQLTPLNGKTISVSGKIKEYNGQVEIVLESPEQILK
jgi:DNA/RNA endonuclease YhcR with UshA esterase domain